MNSRWLDDADSAGPVTGAGMQLDHLFTNRILSFTTPWS